MPVTSVTDLINLLAARRQASILHDRRTGMPYSWSHWLRERVSRAVTAFARADVDAVMAARPAPARERVPAPRPLWQVIALMFWHGGDPPPRDQRGLRWFAGFFSGGLHVLFALLLLWVALVRSNVPDESAEEGERVQVQYIGRGTPDEEGGGAPKAAGEAQPAASDSAVEAAAQASASATTAAQTAPAEPAAAAAAAPAARPAEVAAADAEEATMPIDASKPAPELPSAQPLQVTETTQPPTTDFVLPPPSVRPPVVAQPAVRAPDVQVRERTVETAAELPTVAPQVRVPAPLPVRVRTPDVQVQERQVEVAPRQQVQMAQVRTRSAEVQLPSRDMAVRERQVQAAPREPVAMAQVRSSATEVQLKTPAVAVRERSLPGVPDRPATSSSGTSGAAPTAQRADSGAAAMPSASSSQSAAAGSHAAGKPAPEPGTSTGAGPKPEDRSGGWASPARGDDWSASRRDVAGSAGGQSDNGKGLFNADGSVRLAGTQGQDTDGKRGAPGGDSDTWSRERIAESGTWLKRPPYDYTPTSFDKYWVPNESLLAEWVRKGIKSIEIPIPGSSSKISCVVSMLQFGGGCGLTNPNMQEQPAEARPPPDVPFKKELQEDNGSR